MPDQRANLPRPVRLLTQDGTSAATPRAVIAVTAVICATFAAVTTRYAHFVGAITDGSGYVSQAARWLRGELFGPMPFVSAPVGVDPAWFMPLGYRFGVPPATDVFVYPPGLSLMFVPLMAVGGELAVHLVPPLMGGVLIWATADLAGHIAGPKARVLAAMLMATSAIAMLMATQPMSDIPAAALWLLALALVVRATTLAAAAGGLAISLAILTRPNLAPLAVVPVLLAVNVGRTAHAVRAAFVAIGAVGGVGLLMWTQQVLYGSPLASGHQGIEQLFAFSHVPDNVGRYLQWYMEAHTPAILLAVIAPVMFWGYSAHYPLRRPVVVALMTFALMVYLAYLPYYPYPDWPFLRFMLPALAALYALTGSVVARAVDHLPAMARWPVVALFIVVIAGMQAQQAMDKQVTEQGNWTARVSLAGHYLHEVLPHNAVVMTYFHSGSVRFYTGLPVLRPDLVPGGQLDMTIERLSAAGYRVYLLVDDELERGGLLEKFPNTRSLGTLEWPPRAQIGTYGRLDLFDLADRKRHGDGERWPTDVVR
jgi:hypothetical protein